MRTIGLIGGMSWESTRIYYELLNREVQKRLGGLNSARVILSSMNMADIASLQSAGRWDEAGSVLAAEAVRLEAAGAQLMALATNTMHVCAEQIVSATRVPFVHIVDVLARHLIDDQRHRPLLLATRFTMEQAFYRDRLRSWGIDPLVPGDQSRSRLHSLIYDELCRGIVTGSGRQFIREVVAEGAANGADSVILGCTEICMVADSGLALPQFDTTALHAAALVNDSLRDLEKATP